MFHKRNVTNRGIKKFKLALIKRTEERDKNHTPQRLSYMIEDDDEVTGPYHHLDYQILKKR